MCDNGWIHTYCSKSKHGFHGFQGELNYGGYTQYFTINKNFAIKIPESYPLEKAGPVFCAGITLYHPLKTYNAHHGNKKVAIVGLGGLGMMGAKLAIAMGNEVSIISTSPSKKDKALEIGCKNFILSTNPEEMKAFNNYFDLVLNTVSVTHDAVP